MLLARASYHGVGVEGHDHPSHAEVCHSQGDDEVVGDVLEGPLLGHGEDDQHIAKHHGDAENEQQQRPVVLVVEESIRVNVRGK